MSATVVSTSYIPKDFFFIHLYLYGIKNRFCVIDDRQPFQGSQYSGGSTDLPQRGTTVGR
jgi:hypothetical protein